MLSLLHLCDSLFPIGAFAYSDGLEAAAAGMTGVGDLADWLDVCLDETIRRCEGPAVWRAWTAFVTGQWDTLGRLDREVIVLRPSASGRQSTRAMGLRLLTTWSTLHPESRLEHVLSMARCGALGPSLPVAFAIACASAGLDGRQAVEGFAYTRLASTISAGMRVMPIGQSDAHAALARALDRVPPAVDAIATSNAPLEAFTPMMDIAAMSQQYLHSRLFRS